MLVAELPIAMDTAACSEALTAGGTFPPSAARPVLLAGDAASTGKALLPPTFKGCAPSGVNGPLQGACHCSAVVASEC